MAFISVAILTVVPLATLCGSDSAVPAGYLPQEYYPDADIILTETADGGVLITYRAFGDSATQDLEPVWLTSVTSKNADITLRSLTDVRDDLLVVFDGPRVGKLSILYADNTESLNVGANVEFRMYSGNIQTLTLLSASSNVTQSLGTSYDSLVNPIRDANIKLFGGEIDCYDPTMHMVSVTNYQLYLGYGVTVNKLYTTGENGRYSNVEVSINGAHIGYMTNIASKIGTLKYDILAGSIDYFAIGADTERSTTNTTNMLFSTFPTSFVTGDVSVHTDPSVKIQNCIMGAGILNMPLVLSNGEYLSETIIHTVIIDTPGVVISNDTCFLTEDRAYAYHFNYYKVDGSPYASKILQRIYVNSNSIKIYSDEGVWKDYNSCTIPVGAVLSLNADFIIPADGSLTVMKGASLYNSGNIMNRGVLDIKGNVINNLTVQCWPDSVLRGSPKGDGYLADYIPSSDDSLHMYLSSSRSSMMVDMGDGQEIESIHALMSDDESIVNIYLDGPQTMTGKFLLTLSWEEAPKDFNGKVRLDLRGLDPSLRISAIGITLPTNPAVCTAVYVLDDGHYEVVSTSEYESDIVFPAGSFKEFYLLEYTTERPELPEPPVKEDEKRMSNIDYFLIAAIIAVLAVTVYALVTMKRD